jgi:hypothetical protein
MNEVLGQRNWIEGCIYLPAKEEEGATDDDVRKVTDVREFSSDESQKNARNHWRLPMKLMKIRCVSAS